ncbi:MAG: hypothetical protein EPO20_24990 [Betaproteobacteria bacterium]|nr:MAG: hypothetical protein EPO20_24990 [Betaproteobacteria bacterium]
MEPLTYERYLADPSVREKLERQARQERSEAVYGFFIVPLIRLFKRTLSKPALRLQPRSA